MFNIVLISLGLTMDSFAISGAISLASQPVTRQTILRVSTLFTLFQVSLLIIGWQIGGLASNHLNSYAEIAASLLLIVIGIKMIWETYNDNIIKTERDISRGLPLMILAIATSIDALAVGGSLGLLNSAIFLPAVILTFATIFMSILGLLLGKQFGQAIGLRAELIGGFVLILIGIKIMLS